MDIKFCSLSSGSEGNCQYIETSHKRILVDSGFSGKKTETLLKKIGICPTTLDGILVTHEHIDHIKGVGVLSRRYDIPVYGNIKTWEAMDKKLGNIKESNKKIFSNEKFFNLGDLEILPFKIFHDAADPVGYIISKDNKKISLLTDTGFVSKDIAEKIKDSNMYFLESNHDIEMLREGSYPYYLKERIRSKVGHLSNEDAGNLMGNLLSGIGEKIILAHLSDENNMPQKALSTVKTILERRGLNTEEDIEIEVSKIGIPTKIYTV